MYVCVCVQVCSAIFIPDVVLAIAVKTTNTTGFLLAPVKTLKRCKPKFRFLGYPCCTPQFPLATTKSPPYHNWLSACTAYLTI